MEFHKLGEKERRLLLELLGLDHSNLRCLICGDIVKYQNCSILPAMIGGENADILCESMLCLSTWLTDTEDAAKCYKKSME